MTTVKKPSKLSLLLRLLRQDPGELSDRILTFADFHAGRLRKAASVAPVDPAECMRQLGDALNGRLEPYLQEAALAGLERHVEREREKLRSDAAFGMFHAADLSLARLCYAVCRLQKPSVAVETGVAHGVTTAFLLQAMAENGAGELWSIDLPPLAGNSDDQVGFFVPAGLRPLWRLRRGRTRHLLPRLVSELPSIDLFLHDSLHTYRNMRWEFETVWPRLRPGGVLLSDDINMNRAFERFSERPDAALAVASVQEAKDSVFGVIVKSRAAAA